MKLKVKITPSPWEVTGFSKDCIAGTYSEKHNSMVCQLFTHTREEEDGDWKANARLISKTPEMYELLNMISDVACNFPLFWFEENDWNDGSKKSFNQILEELLREIN